MSLDGIAGALALAMLPRIIARTAQRIGPVAAPPSAVWPGRPRGCHPTTGFAVARAETSLLLPNAEPLEDAVEDVVGDDRAGDFAKLVEAEPQVEGDQFVAGVEDHRGGGVAEGGGGAG